PANPAVTAPAQPSPAAPALAMALSTDEPASEPLASAASPDEPSTAVSPVLTPKTLPVAAAITPADPDAPLLSPGTPREAEPEAWISGGTNTGGQRVDRGASMGVPAGPAAAAASVPSPTAHRAGVLAVPPHSAPHTTIAASRTLEPAPVFVSLSETANGATGAGAPSSGSGGGHGPSGSAAAALTALLALAGLAAFLNRVLWALRRPPSLVYVPLTPPG
ncbi:MAG TPA: hypothetical protein VFD32_02155, partial [Dehalococcoidia bacterium]|nr:hypothetical protein [Dehalococcoidia bacterium]